MGMCLNTTDCRWTERRNFYHIVARNNVCESFTEIMSEWFKTRVTTLQPICYVYHLFTMQQNKNQKRKRFYFYLSPPTLFLSHLSLTLVYSQCNYYSHYIRHPVIRYSGSIHTGVITS